MRKFVSRVLMLAVLGILAACNSATPVDAADTVLLNGKIVTVNDEFSIAEALAIEGTRIVAVGDSKSISERIGATTRVVDLQGKTVIPGLIDNHMHFIRAAQRWNLQARIDGVNSRSEALAIIAKKAANTPAGDWIMVQGGWRENQFADLPGGFTLQELDAAAPQNPLFLQITYQTVYANSLALEAVGVSPAEGARHAGPPLISPQPPYGLLNEQMPTVSDAQIEQNLLDFIAVLNAAGLTSVYDVGRPPEGDILLLEKMSADGPLPIRAWHTLKYQAYDPDGAAAAIKLVKESAANSTDDYLGMFGLGEHVYLPFFDLPGMTDPYGDDVVDPLMKILTAAAEGGFHVHEHTMLDTTIKTLLGPLEELNKSTPLAPLRWSLAHVLNISDESIERANALGLTAAVHSVAMYAPPQYQPPIRAIQDSGMVWGLGTDATIVAHYQPFITLGWVVSGKSINGETVIDKSVTREEALIAHTRSNAYLMWKEDDLGSLEVGKLADLVVLDRDYMTVAADEIFDIKPVMTMVGGRVVYDANENSTVDEPADSKRIVVFGATGSIGQSIVAEALGRGHDVTGVSRSPEKFAYSEDNFTAARGNPTDVTSVAELVANVDAIIIAVGGRTATNPKETAMNQTAIAVTEALADLGPRSPQIVVVAGGLTMQGSRENIIANMPPNASEGSAMYALFLGHWEAYETYLKSDTNWTFVAPPMNILGFREGPDVRTGKYRTSTTERIVTTDGKNEISMSDLAVAVVDFAEKTDFNRVKVTVGY